MTHPGVVQESTDPSGRYSKAVEATFIAVERAEAAKDLLYDMIVGETQELTDEQIIKDFVSMFLDPDELEKRGRTSLAQLMRDHKVTH